MRAALAIALLASGCGRFDFGSQVTDAASGDAADAVIDTAPVDLVRYPMDDTPSLDGMVAADPTDFSVMCAECPLSTVGKTGGGYAFDGTPASPIVRIPHPELITPSRPFTAAFWFATTGTNFMGVLSKPIDEQTSAWNVMSIWIGVNGDLAWEISLSGATTAIGTTGVDVRDGAWHHVAATWDGTTRVLYLNGALVDQSTLAFDDSPSDILFGGDIDPGLHLPFSGALDDLRFYHRALSAAEVQTLSTP